MAQSIASRPRRPQQGEPDDVVLARAVQFSEWARRNVTLIAIGAVLAVVLLAALFWYRTDRQRRLDDAAIAFLQVEQSVMTGDDAMAVRDLQLFVQQHGATPYGDEARVLLGQVHLRAERTSEAINVLRPVAERLDRSPVGVQAALLLGTAQEMAGDTEAATQTYLQVADESERLFQRQEALMNAALLMQQAGDHAGAAELYQRLVSTAEPGSNDRLMFEMRLAEAEALATLQ
jgi:predicted negative regulator of RcsB-dependent stress response